MQLEEVGIRATSGEKPHINTEVIKDVEDLEKEAKRTNVDVEEVTAKASSKAEAIYLVQVALEESENRVIEIREKEKFPKLN